MSGYPRFPGWKEPTTSRDAALAINPRKIITDCQRRISESYVRGGDSHAFVALACASVTLQAYIEAGSLIPAVLDELAETADNLGLTKRLGQDVVDIALDCGVMFFDTIDQHLHPTPQHSPANPLAAEIHAGFWAKMAPGGPIEKIPAGFPPPGRPTPQVVVEAVMYVVRQQGPSALCDDPDTHNRLTRCDPAARAQINRRIAKLFPGKAAA